MPATASILGASGSLSATAHGGTIREHLIVRILQAVDGEYGIPAPEDERDVPVTIVQDGEDEVAIAYDTCNVTMPINVARAEAAANTNRNTMRAHAHRMLGALVAAMHADETFGGLARGVDYTGGGIALGAGPLVFAEAAFRVRYSHARGRLADAAPT
jgi:hypothetical protein